MQIFISYRRDDSAVRARLLHRELSRFFGADEVFMDFEDIGWGDNFAERIDEQLASADVVIVVVGARWTEIIGQRLRGDDWVRHEVEQALQRRAAGGLRVLPVLVGGASWHGDKLPRGLAELPMLNSPTLRDDRFDQDVVAVVEAIRQRTLWRELVALARARQARLAALGIGLVVGIGAWTGVLDLLSLDTHLNTVTMSLAASFGAPPPLTGQLVLVPIDEAAVQAVGKSFSSSWRAEHAKLITRASNEGARSVAFDLFFDTPGEPADDAALAQALQLASGKMRVVLGANEPAPSASGPHIVPGLLRAADSRWGVACAGRRLGWAYSMPLVIAPADGSAARPSLALAAVADSTADLRIEASDKVARSLSLAIDGHIRELAFFDAEVQDSVQKECPIIAAGDWVAQQLLDPASLSQPFTRVAYADILDGDPVALSALSERIVLVGLMLPERDRMQMAGRPTRWGMELIAAQIEGLLEKERPERSVRLVGPAWQAALGIALGLAGTTLAVTLHGRRRYWLWAALLGLALVYAAAVLFWFKFEGQLVGVHYGWVSMVLGALLARRIMRSAL